MRLKPSKLEGEIKAIASKSYAHRALICAAISKNPSQIYFDKSSDDIDATISCLNELGAEIVRNKRGAFVNPIEKRDTIPLIDPKESGSTLRFLLPLSASIYDSCKFTGSARLSERPLIDLIKVMEENGVSFDRKKLPFMTFGKFDFEDVTIRADISSQYITGLMLTAANLNKNTKINLTEEIESKSYLNITISVMKAYGIDVREIGKSFEIFGKKLHANDYRVEGDFSNASFFLAAGALSAPIKMFGLNINSKQGDRKILDILKDYGANVIINDNFIEVSPNLRNPLEIDLKNIPDMFPILAILASGANGKSRFYNIKRLRLKESDRIESTKQMIENLGGKFIEKNDEVFVIGNGKLKPGKVDSFNDHRIVMAAAIASFISEGNVEIINEKAVEKSYPSFFEDFSKLGGSFDS